MRPSALPIPRGFSRRKFLGKSTLLLLSAAAIRHSVQAATPTDFTLQQVGGGKPFKSGETRGKIIALHFLLKTECPFCLRHTHEYARQSAGMKDVVHLFIKPDTESEIQAWLEKGPQEESFKALKLYRDPDATLARTFGIPHGYKFHGQVVHFPALVVLNRKGEEIFRHVGKDNSDRFSVEQFKARLNEWNSAR